MNEKKEDPLGFEAIFSSWMKSVSTLWGDYAGLWLKPPVENQSDRNSTAGTGKDTKAAMAAALKSWQTLSQAMTTPESLASLFKGAGTMPEILTQMAQRSLGSFVDLQSKMVERAGRLGESVEAYQFEDLDENIFRVWTDIYENEFRQFFHIPQLGLTRVYQERVNQVVDHYNIFQASLAEFLRLLGMPLSRSLRVMQEKLGEIAENGTLPDDSRDYYQMWIKILEGHYMTLFQTPEYVETLSRTVNALADYSNYKDAFLEDMLSVLPVANRTEMDDLAQDVYELKKRLRMLERRSCAGASAVA